MSDKSSPLKRLVIEINVWVKLPEGENIFTLLRILMQVTLSLSTAWRESHASHYDRVVPKRKYLRNNIGNEPILALPEGSDNLVVMRGARRHYVYETKTIRIIKFSNTFSIRRIETEAETIDEELLWGWILGEPRKIPIWKDAIVVVDAWSRKGGVKPRQLARLYVDEAIARHGVHVSSIPDKDGMYIEALERDVEVVRDTSRYEILTFCNAEIREGEMFRLELELEMTKVVVIKERLEEAKDRQKSYADNSRKPLEFEEPVENNNREVKRFKCSRMVIVKVRLDWKRGEDPIYCINKAMAFLFAVASRFPPSNNQLRTLTNPRNQATIHDGRVIVQQVQRRQIQSYAGSGNTGIATTSKGNVAVGPSRVVKCYNCQGEGHMARQCTHLKRPRNAAWFKEKFLLAEAQEAGQILDEQQLAFLADPGIPEAPVAQQTIP
ncbi:retrovirus-related pol polyprotein from transposon TNT 1-94 [Tanacetum coccineum]